MNAGVRDAALDAGGDTDAPLPEVGADYLSWPALDVPPDGELTLSFDVPSDARAFVLTLDPRATPRHVQLCTCKVQATRCCSHATPRTVPTRSTPPAPPTSTRSNPTR